MSDYFFKTNDGVNLHYIEEGTVGQPLVIVHGWRSEAAEYCHNILPLSERFKVYLLELRGHGQSDHPDYGFRLSRLAMDLNEFIQSLPYEKVNIMAHSMGCLVTYNYIDLFGQDKINKLILVDAPTFCAVVPGESEEERKSHGGSFKDIWKLYNALNISLEEGGKEFEVQSPAPANDISAQSLYYQKSKQLPRAQLNNPFHASLLLSIATNDCRDIVKRITVKTMYIFGETSRCTYPELAKWMADHIPDCTLVSFSREEYGRHSMFCANPVKFNKEVLNFLL